MNPFLAVGSRIYGAVVAVRNAAFDRGLLAAHRLRRPVISVGNIEVGGVGKTPFVRLLVDLLVAEGAAVCVLSRGYGRKSSAPRVVVSRGSGALVSAEEGGDEPVMLAGQCAASVVVGPDRVANARWAISALQPDVFVLDDGFQHRRLSRDLDIVLVREGTAADLLLPAGCLREHPSALRRAHLVVRVESGEGSTQGDSIEIAVQVAVEGFQLDGEEFEPDWLKDRGVVLISAIANADRFRRSVEGLGAEVVHHEVRGDHEWLSAGDFAGAQRDGTVLLTTEKDAARLGGAPAGVGVVCVRHQVVRGKAKLLDALAGIRSAS